MSDAIIKALNEYRRTLSDGMCSEFDLQLTTGLMQRIVDSQGDVQLATTSNGYKININDSDLITVYEADKRGMKPRSISFIIGKESHIIDSGNHSSHDVMGIVDAIKGIWHGKIGIPVIGSDEIIYYDLNLCTSRSIDHMTFSVFPVI
jgi:hypothetical protein